MAIRATALVLTGWLTMVGCGMGLLLAHGTTAGTVGAVPPRLPAPVMAALTPASDRPLVLVFAHPQCPCLPSTVTELRRTLADAPPVDLRVIVYTPRNPPQDWDPQKAAALPSQLPMARCHADLDGALAANLGALTSGHVQVFGPDGLLRFSGGVTAGRGHVGDNGAARAFGKSLSALPIETSRTAVFGCPIRADDGSVDETCCRPSR